MELNSLLNNRDLPGLNKRSQKLALKIDTLPEKIKLKHTVVKQYERRFKEEKDIDAMSNTTSGEYPYDKKSEYSGISFRFIIKRFGVRQYPFINIITHYSLQFYTFRL